MNRVDTESLWAAQRSIQMANSDAGTTLCAWCGRIKEAGGEWQLVPSVAIPANSTHGICPDCIASEMRAGERN